MGRVAGARPHTVNSNVVQESAQSHTEGLDAVRSTGSVTERIMEIEDDFLVEPCTFNFGSNLVRQSRGGILSAPKAFKQDHFSPRLQIILLLPIIS